MAYHLRAEGFDELELTVEIRAVERLDAAGSINGKPVAFRAVVERHIADVMNGTHDEVRAERVDCGGYGFAVTRKRFGLESHVDVDHARPRPLQPPRLREVSAESCVDASNVEWRLVSRNQIRSVGRHVLGETYPAESRVDIRLHNIAQGVGCMAAELSAMPAVYRYKLNHRTPQRPPNQGEAYTEGEVVGVV